jgi:hypothetical protein
MVVRSMRLTVGRGTRGISGTCRCMLVTEASRGNLPGLLQGEKRRLLQRLAKKRHDFHEIIGVLRCVAGLQQGVHLAQRRGQ